MTDSLEHTAIAALEDLKGKDIVSIDVHALTDVMDRLIICTGTSNRHVKSLADNVIDELKQLGKRPLGVEGKEQSEWVLVDYGDLVVHVMLPSAREFYELEKLWQLPPTRQLETDADD